MEVLIQNPVVRFGDAPVHAAGTIAKVSRRMREYLSGRLTATPSATGPDRNKSR
jgi:hypothetical protein